jgi:hypothetical protein
MNEDRLSSAAEQEYTCSMQHLTLPIIVENDQDGYFVTCPTLQGCYSQGETYEEAIMNIKDAHSVARRGPLGCRRRNSRASILEPVHC